MVSTPLHATTHAMLDSVATTTVAETALLLRSPLIKDEPNAPRTPESINFQVVSITDFPECGYLGNSERSISVKNQLATAYKYQLQPNDVLISIVGSIGRVAIVPPDFQNQAIPSSNLVIFRLFNPDPQAAILAGMFYKSDMGQKILADLTHGKTIPLISKKTFAKTPFPVIENEVIYDGVSLFNKEIWAKQKCMEIEEDVRTARKHFLSTEDPTNSGKQN